MHALALIIALALGGQLQDDDLPQDPQVLEQRVECIAVAHIEGGTEKVFFFGFVQGEWTCLDDRWLSVSSMLLYRQGDDWVLAWDDGCDNGIPCYRVVSTGCYVESWEVEHPMTAQRNAAWFQQLLQPGLMQPKRMR